MRLAAVPRGFLRLWRFGRLALEEHPAAGAGVVIIVVHNRRSDEDEQVLLVAGLGFLAESQPGKRDVAQDRHLGVSLGLGVVHQAAHPLSISYLHIRHLVVN